MWGKKYRVKDAEPVIGWSARDPSARGPTPSGKKSTLRPPESPSRRGSSFSAAGGTSSGFRRPLGLGIGSGKSTRSTSKTAPASSSSSTFTPKVTKVVRPDAKDATKLNRVFERFTSFRRPNSSLRTEAVPWPSSVSTLLDHPNDAGYEQWCKSLDARFPEQSISPAAADSESGESYTMEAFRCLPQPLLCITPPVVAVLSARAAHAHHAISPTRSPTWTLLPSLASGAKSKESITPTETPVTPARKVASATPPTETPSRPSRLPLHATADPTRLTHGDVPISPAPPSIAALSSAGSSSTLDAPPAICRLPSWLILFPNPVVADQQARVGAQK
eukprot:GEMP01019651.1.p1 GENE.GEMP01019651.1~~GEMP01019651.1.p1  ORF type:complete len:333 (+),score=84.83 GEMP01019651.1:51-1049(+)